MEPQAKQVKLIVFQGGAQVLPFGEVNVIEGVDDRLAPKQFRQYTRNTGKQSQTVIKEEKDEMDANFTCHDPGFSLEL